MLLDNKAHGKVGDVLIDAIAKDAQVSILTNLFSVYGFSALQEQLNAAASLRVLLPGDSKPSNTQALFRLDGLAGDETERQFRNAIDKIENYNGCIIADSVGLGKTFEALAIIKYYELRNDRVLVLCPKKIRENWTLYTINDRRNLFAADRFNFDVLNHTDLTRLRGKSGEINLETLNWGNYDLIVIDESHNFRNNPPRKDGLTRYSRLMRDIIRSGVRTKVLMLSATPVNSRMNDLKNQVAFITEGVDDALWNSGIASVHGLRPAARTESTAMHSEISAERLSHEQE